MRQTMRTRQWGRVAPIPARSGGELNRRQRWKSSGPVVIVASAALAFIAILVLLSVTRASHPAVGTWRHEYLTLTVDPDNVATVYGIVCSWKEIDHDTIRIQPPMKIDVPHLGTLELAFRLTLQEGGQRAVLDAFGSPLTLERDGPAK